MSLAPRLSPYQCDLVGVCRRCQRVARVTMLYCRSCQEWKNERNRVRILARRASGLCARCCSSSKRYICPACSWRLSLSNQESSRRVYERRVAEGLCVRCGGQTLGYRICAGCRARMRAQRAGRGR